MTSSRWRLRIGWLTLVVALCAACDNTPPRRLTLATSALGPEAQVVRDQLAGFVALHPGVEVDLRVTPDAADQRHQLFVQWLNAHAAEPDVLQLDVIWTAEFAGAGWLRPLDDAIDNPGDFVPAALDAARWNRHVYAVPWFVDVGLLYWRTDLMPNAPTSLTEMRAEAGRLVAEHQVPFGVVWQGARYEGLVTVFLEHLTAFGGRIFDEHGRVVVHEPAAVRALTFMCESIRSATTPPSVLTWQEEQTRLVFQNGAAAFMRNWPYAWPLMQDAKQSRVAARFAVTAFPAADGGRPSAALGGAQLAVNARSRHPDLAGELVQYLTDAAQMRERAERAGQLPARRSLYADQAVLAAFGIPPDDLRRIVDTAVARPVTPVYTELSEILQVRVHQALSGQLAPAEALREAAGEIERLLARTALAPRQAGS